MTTLAERAEALAASPFTGPSTPAPQPAVAEPLPDINVDDTLDPESAKLDAIHAWTRVRRDIRAIGKGEKYSANGTQYMFRGVETAINAFSPVTLRHGINVIPFKKVTEYFETNTSRGNRQVDCRVSVTWRVYGPQGDFFEAASCGQALDTQDKACAKAQSVAFRVFLYEAGMIPTQEVDPEYTAHDRGEARVRDPQDYFTEILKKSTSRERLLAIRGELMRLRLAREPIVNEEGEHEELVTALERIGKVRFAPQQPAHTNHEPGALDSTCPRCQAESAAVDRAADGGAV